MRLLVKRWPLRISQPRMFSELPSSDKISFLWGTWWAVIEYIRIDEKVFFFYFYKPWNLICIFLCLVGWLSPWLLVFQVFFEGKWLRLTVILLRGHIKSWDKIQMSDFETRVLTFWYWQNWLSIQILNCKYKSSNCSNNTWSFFSVRFVQIDNHKPFIQDNALTWALIASFITLVSKLSTPGWQLSSLCWPFITLFWTDKISDPPPF